jgi:hypothetical protein
MRPLEPLFLEPKTLFLETKMCENTVSPKIGGKMSPKLEKSVLGIMQKSYAF